MNRVQKHSSTSQGSARKPQTLESADIQETGRSCINCHKRKVRCDRKAPCEQCIRWNWACTYSSSRREVVRKPSPFEEITGRLDRLESILLEALNKHPLSQPSALEKHGELIPQPLSKQISPRQSRSAKHWEVLLRNGNSVHYVDNSNVLDLFQDEEQIPSNFQPSSENTPDDSSLTIEASLVEKNRAELIQLLPSAQFSLKLWTTFVENVDPVLKILHIPTTQTAIISLIANPREASPSVTALAFAIYFAAATSLDDKRILEISSENRQTLLNRYKQGLNKIIVESNLLNEPDITSLQAMAIFATCLRVHEVGRAVWVLAGAIRLAQSIGIHRDGSSLKLSPFETELRIRLWWLLCLLDSRAPEDHGFAHTIEHLDQNLRLPLNIDDDQLFPTMQSLPLESESWTDMSFSLVQIEIARMLQQIVEKRITDPSDFNLDLQSKRRMMEEHDNWVNRRFLVKTEPSQLQQIANIHYRSACAKMEFMLQLKEQLHGRASKNYSPDAPRSLGKSCLLAAFRDIESNHSLISGDASAQFVWLFQSYTKWYSLTYVLRYLCSFPFSAEAEQGWALVNRTFSFLPYFRNLPPGESSEDKGGSMWRCLAILYRQAINSRDNLQCSSISTTAREGRPEDVNVYGSDIPNTEHSDDHIPNQQAVSVNSETAQQSQHQEAFMPNLSTNWQNGLFTFGEPSMPEMLYLPEWNDIVNFSIS